MDIVDFLLDGLEAALELERELGVRTVEVDRALLAGETRFSSVSKVSKDPLPQSPHPPKPANVQTILPLAFLHDRPLSQAGVEMMAKILNALGRPNAPIVVVPPMPKAKVVVVLGGRALRLYFPELKGEPGQWVKLPTGEDVLITYSPEYILRFGAVTPAVQKLKQDMWRSLKAVAQRLRV